MNTRPILPPPSPTSRHYIGDSFPWKSLLILILGATVLLSIVLEYRDAQAQVAIQPDCSTSYPTGRYISPWTTIPAHSEYAFAHGFKCGPLELDVWAKLSGQAVDDLVTVPYLELKGSIKVSSVTSTAITIRNTSSNPITVQVVARP